MTVSFPSSAHVTQISAFLASLQTCAAVRRYLAYTRSVVFPIAIWRRFFRLRCVDHVLPLPFMLDESVNSRSVSARTVRTLCWGLFAVNSLVFINGKNDNGKFLTVLLFATAGISVLLTITHLCCLCFKFHKISTLVRNFVGPLVLFGYIVIGVVVLLWSIYYFGNGKFA